MTTSGNGAQSKDNHFAKRLTELCKTRPSASAVARDLGINRQQFARYLNGESIPRQAINRKIAEYFVIDPGLLFSNRPIAAIGGASSAATSTVKAMAQLLNGAKIGQITGEDLEPGFYWQYKTLLRMPGKILKTLVMVQKDGDIYRYKRRSSVLYNALVNSTVKNTFNGVFFKQNGFLILIDIEVKLGDMTIHAFATSNHYDPSIKPGLHMTVGLMGGAGPRAARLFLKKIPDDESILSHARKQGVFNIADLSTADAYILVGDGTTGFGVLHL